jgi:hypothetical protein
VEKKCKKKFREFFHDGQPNRSDQQVAGCFLLLRPPRGDGPAADCCGKTIIGLLVEMDLPQISVVRMEYLIFNNDG